MNCTDAEKYLYLYREGELTAEEQSVLQRHLEECSSCHNIAMQLQSLRHLAKKEYESLPLPADMDEEINTILALTTGNKHTLPEKNKEGILLRITFNKAVRLASAGLVAAIVLLFLLQNYMAFTSIVKLEQKYGNPGRYTSSASTPLGTLSSEDLRFLEAAQMYLRKTIGPLGTKTASRNLFLLSFRKHKELREIASRASDFDPFWINLINQDITAKTITDHQNTRR